MASHSSSAVVTPPIERGAAEAMLDEEYAAPNRQYTADDYTVALVCALPLEMAAAKGMLDQIHPNLSEQAPADHNSYILGRLQAHNVVIACLPAGVYGAAPAATVAKDLLRTFKSIRFGLMVGIGGGAPSPSRDIRLGDIVVSQPAGVTGGVIQYDRGKTGQEGRFERTGSLNKPPPVLLTALARLQADRLTGDCRIPEFLSALVDRYPKMKKAFTFQGEPNDCLFQAEYEHVGPDPGCEKCDRTHAVRRDARDDTDPVIHYGNIASGNQVIKHATTRDRLSKDHDVLCFEMEAAGLMEDFPCLVIRGICDYADSHKNKVWQGYAAAVAAAFAKELLSVIAPGRVLQEKPIPQLVSDPVLQELVSNTNEAISTQTSKQGIRYENEKQIECHRAFKTSKYEDFKNINPDRVPDTCNWVLGHPQFVKWRQSRHDDLLWISADPGCGKSVLAKSLIEKELRSTSDHTVCYFFFKDNEEQHGLATALCAILHQLFSSKPQLLRHAAIAFERNGTKLQHEVDELWRIFLAAATDESANAVTCVLDALDECREDDRRKLIRLLTEFYARRSSASKGKFQLRFLVTSRPYRDIESCFGNIPREAPSIRLAGEESNADISEEINIVIRQKIRAAGDKLHPDQGVRDALQEKLLETPHRTYLWLHLVWDELENSSKRTKKGFMRQIDSLPSTVEEAYEKILNRPRRGQREEVEVLLHIVVGARRPLTLTEMDVAFQLSTESRDALQHEDLDLDGEGLKSRIRDLCGLFVFISDNRIYLIHQTAKEFLVARESAKESDANCWRHSLEEQYSNQILVRVCLQYFSFHDIRHGRFPGTKGKYDPDFDGLPLLEYSAVNWPAHARDMGSADEGLFDRIFELYDAHDERFETWVSIFWKASRQHRSRLDMVSLHWAALNGHDRVVAKLIQMDQVSIDVKDCLDMTPLLWAAHEGHGKTVQLLLAKGADVNALGIGDRARNALGAASANGHQETVALLLDKGADVNAQGIGDYYNNALEAASAKGYQDIVTLLLAKGADVNAQGIQGIGGINIYSNALEAASANGYQEIVALLLAKGADVNAQGTGGTGRYSNALHAASANGHQEIAALLLDNGAITWSSGPSL